MYHSLMLLAGMLILFCSPFLPAVAVIIFLAILSLVLYQSKWPHVRLLATLIFAYGWAALYAVDQRRHDLPSELVNQSALLSACILGTKIHSANYRRVLINVSDVRKNGQPVDFKGKVSLSHFGPDNGLYQNGWCGELTAKLKPVHGRLNRRGFDYEAWAYVQGIKALGTFKHVGNFQPGEDIHNLYLQFKSELINDLSHTLNHTSSFELVISLAAGERDLIASDVWRVLRQSGTSHLLAISGLHIGLVFWMVSALTMTLWRVLVPLSLYFSAQKLGWLSGLAFAGGYLVLTGLPLSGRRAWVMLACFVLVRIFDNKIEFTKSLSIALWIILMVWPSSVLSIGFWFSYVAVALILSQSVHLNIGPGTHSGLFEHRIARKISKLIKIQCLLSIAICPLNVIYFGEISLISPFANLIAVPIMTIVILPVILAGTFFQLLGWLAISQPILFYAANCLDWLYGVISLLCTINGSVSMPEIHHPYTWYLLLTGVFVFNQFRMWPGRWMLCILFLPLLIQPKSKLQSGEFELNIFDVGQGLSIWFKSENHNMLVDTGFGIENGFNYFESVVYPLLKAEGVNKLDALVISHGDADHAGGLNALIKSDIDVSRIYSSKQHLQTLGNYCDHRIAWQWDEINFRFFTRQEVTGENNRSCILKIQSKFSSALLPGDIERETELKLVRKYGLQLSADLLVVPHHGSATSSTQHFLNSVSPMVAAVSAGYLNRYGHPAGKILERYRKNNIRLVTTACSGQLSFLFDIKGINLSQLRQTRQPFWRHQCQQA